MSLVQPSYYFLPPIVVGEHTYLSECCHVAQMTTIGKFCSIGNLCTIGAQPHPVDELMTFPQSMLFPERPATAVKTSVGNDVWIGSNSVIMGGVSVGDGAVIGAGSVVTATVPAYAIVAGNPARLLRFRFEPRIIEELLRTEWWNLPLDEIKLLPLRDVEACVDRLCELRRLAA